MILAFERKYQASLNCTFSKFQPTVFWILSDFYFNSFLTTLFWIPIIRFLFQFMPYTALFSILSDFYFNSYPLYCPISRNKCFNRFQEWMYECVSLRNCVFPKNRNEIMNLAKLRVKNVPKCSTKNCLQMNAKNVLFFYTNEWRNK